MKSAWCLTLAAILASHAFAQVPDHLKCYKIKDALRLGGVVDIDTPQFGAETGCKVLGAKLFCIPAEKSVVSAMDKATRMPITPLPVSHGAADGDRVCYKIKCPHPGPVIPGQTATDQFGTRTLNRFKAELLCTPAVKGAAFCGDGTIGAGEECEGSNLGGATCQSLGFEQGTLACGAGCKFDKSGCGCQAFASTFPATGQVRCWDDQGQEITCNGTGHDGDVRAGAPMAFVDNGDGTITDLVTGRMWEKLSLDGSIHDATYEPQPWSEAFVKIATLNTPPCFANYCDWRLPNIKELTSIMDYAHWDPALSPAFNNGCTTGCTVTTCSCGGLFTHWSSTSYGLETRWAFAAGFAAGEVYVRTKTAGAVARAVRGGL